MKKRLTAMMKVMATTAELDMTRALFGNRAIRDGINDSASTSNLVLSRFDIYLHQRQLVYVKPMTDER